jgi:hypothetical protein
MISPAVCLRAGSFVTLVVAVVGMGGCQDPPTPTFPVSGKVTVQKKPLTTGIVTFFPDASKGNTSKESAVGYVGADGTYKLSTSGRDGAPLGWYKVTVNSQPVPTAEPTGFKDAPKGQPINSKYLKPDASGILIEVTDPPKPGAYDIDLK